MLEKDSIYPSLPQPTATIPLSFISMQSSFIPTTSLLSSIQHFTSLTPTISDSHESIASGGVTSINHPHSQSKPYSKSHSNRSETSPFMLRLNPEGIVMCPFPSAKIYNTMRSRFFCTMLISTTRHPSTMIELAATIPVIAYGYCTITSYGFRFV